jgi:UDP:flavonoid glycosyltransferase YjiC (YdhE family)
MFHGVPVLAVPFQFEQLDNARKLVAHGMGVISEQAPALRGSGDEHYTATQVEAAARSVLGNAGYAENAARASRALRTYTARRHPYERAADELELALLARRSGIAEDAHPSEQMDGTFADQRDEL